jgi:uncharacterized SAM-binding protein YcdF (DUF218 family)
VIELKVSLIVIGVLILLVGVVSFFNAILLYQFPEQSTNMISTLLVRDYIFGGVVFVAIGGFMIWLGIK